MLIIGLTGPSGAGKGTVAARMAPFGVVSIDTDKVYHTLLIPPSDCLDALVKRFGRDILRSDGTLDRAALAATVFAEGHEADLEALNHITHRYVLAQVKAQCRALALLGCPAVLVDAPLLFESGFDRSCDRTLAVLADREVRLDRIMARDQLSREAAEARLNAQKPDDFYTERAEATVRNDGSPAELDSLLTTLLTEWGVIPA